MANVGADTNVSAPPTALQMYMSDTAAAPVEGEPVAEGAKPVAAEDPNVIWSGNTFMNWTRCYCCMIPVRLISGYLTSPVHAHAQLPQLFAAIAQSLALLV